MTATAWAWVEFVICAGLIGVAGPALSRYGDVIAHLTGLSHTWVGLVLLATATSLPELFTGVSAVAMADAPNIAVGDVFGSCIFNLMILVILDAMHRDESIYRRVHQGHILTAGFGVVMIGFAGASILLGRDGPVVTIFHIGMYTPIIVVLYLVAMRAAFTYEHQRKPAEAIAGKPLTITLRAAIVRYLAAAAVVAVAGAWLPFIGVNIATAMGWQTSFVGTLFVAGATSLPELVVTISAMRIGALDMAIANLLGSNLFDILVLAADDVAYTRGPLLSAVSPTHAVTAFAAVTMSGIVIIALLYRPAARIHGTIGWVSLSLAVIYLFSAYFIYLQGH
jgi:cation:H+ antiporter